VGQQLRSLTSTEHREDLQVLLESASEAGEVTPIIDRTYRLSEVPEAIGI
jgi:hypothetical protein